MTTGFIHNPHDKFFRKTMSQLQVAQEFFKTHLPAEIQRQIDFSTLHLEKDTFIDDSFKASEADLLYSAKLHDQSIVYLYLLCEHLSTVDKEVAFRVLCYLMEIMKQHRAQHPGSPLPIVIPLVLYTGADTWTAPLTIFPLFGEQEDLARSLWPPAYQLIDVHRLSDEELIQHNLSGLLEYVFKYAAVRDVKTFLDKAFLWLSETAKKDFHQAVLLGQNMVFYVSDINQALDKTTFNQVAEKHLAQPLRSEIMTLVEQFRQEGKQEGLQIGLQEGVQRGEVAILKLQLERRFSKLDAEHLTMLEQATPEQLLIWGERILEAHSVSEIFGN